ncbi:hypothetical protein GCK72_004829 [Caenorhabditis remanei]|uniref:C-type lectin domain-containing protein n=1 Tax=Caenorhabditis remanei TaxID=31234 RepID=A0A6A5HAT3_CAERE|nr:hypothetical protein GCK72_004829 [Caenorhabditis remanei]KAF1764878.1 hypothetical protein GCK72_004829 [Caenorhabditis remanei]
MNFLLLIAVSFTFIIPNILCQNSSTTSLNCGYLGGQYNISANESYNGECCNTAAVEYMDQEYLGWRQNYSQIRRNLIMLNDKGYCVLTSTTSTTPTTELSTTPFNCYWLSENWNWVGYSGECCNPESVDYLNSINGSYWRDQNATRADFIKSLRSSGVCGGSTTSTVTSTTVTTVTTNFLSTSTTEMETTSEIGGLPFRGIFW